MTEASCLPGRGVRSILLTDNHYPLSNTPFSHQPATSPKKKKKKVSVKADNKQRNDRLLTVTPTPSLPKFSIPKRTSGPQNSEKTNKPTATKNFAYQNFPDKSNVLP